MDFEIIVIWMCPKGNIDVKAGSGGTEVRSLFKGLCVCLSTEAASPPLYSSFSSRLPKLLAPPSC